MVHTTSSHDRSGDSGARDRLSPLAPQKIQIVQIIQIGRIIQIIEPVGNSTCFLAVFPPGGNVPSILSRISKATSSAAKPWSPVPSGGWRVVTLAKKPL